MLQMRWVSGHVTFEGNAKIKNKKLVGTLFCVGVIGEYQEDWDIIVAYDVRRHVPLWHWWRWLHARPWLQWFLRVHRLS